MAMQPRDQLNSTLESMWLDISGYVQPTVVVLNAIFPY